jgi:outer membrane protein insertion porin family
MKTRILRRRSLFLALLLPMIGAMPEPAWASSSGAAPASTDRSGSQMTVSDIRIDGLQRIGAGTVFTYLPIERGDSIDATRIGEAMRALYKTGFFEDIRIDSIRVDNIRIDREGADPGSIILVVQVTERPAINTLKLSGNKDLKTEDLLANLKDIGIVEGETFDRLALDRVTLELIAPTTIAASTTSRSIRR